MNATVTYVGPLSEGSVQCPATCRNFPFKKGAPFDLPEYLAVNIAAQSPNDWTVPAVVKKLADDKISAEKDAAEVAAKKAETAPAPAISESANSDETP
jgi:hypothetical protein